jgi:hypothetical protein
MFSSVASTAMLRRSIRRWQSSSCRRTSALGLAFARRCFSSASSRHLLLHRPEGIVGQQIVLHCVEHGRLDLLPANRQFVVAQVLAGSAALVSPAVANGVAAPAL